MRVLSFLILCFLILGKLPAQQTDRQKIPVYELPKQDNQLLLEQELAARAPGRAPHFAASLPVAINPFTHGVWEDIGNEQMRWQMRIRSAKAKSLNLGFTDYFMPHGGSLMIYSSDKSIVRGPFSPADNEDHGQLWTPVIEGDELILEVTIPKKAQNQVLLQLAFVNHDFVGLLISGSCNVDVICGLLDGYGIVDDYRDIIRSVGVYSLNGSSTCTGFLINNTADDCQPFFMTADHCGTNSGNAPSMVVYWNYENSVCRTPNSPASGATGDGQLNQFNTGAVFRAGWSGSDFTLVELDDPVSPQYLPFFAGFDARNVPTGDSVIAIHHPNLEEKRISFEYDNTVIGNGTGGTNPNGNYVVVPDWDLGTTEGGSSGSPLFNKQKHVIGQLFGGGAACGNNLYDAYGWIHRSWTGGGTPTTRLQDWLDPGNTGNVVMDGRDCGSAVLTTRADVNVCKPGDALYNLRVGSGFVDSVQMNLVGLPSGLNAQLFQNPTTPGATGNLTITNTSAIVAGTYTFDLISNDGINFDTTNLRLVVSDGSPAVVLTSPLNATTGINPFPLLEWNASLLTEYEVELASDSTFSSLLNSATILGGEWRPGNLDEETTYYWRVRATNACGTGSYSPVRSFTTGALFCEGNASTNVPQIIPNAVSTITSTLTINSPVSVGKLRVRNLNIDHSWIGDLTISLTSPQGTEVFLMDQIPCSSSDIRVDFDDDASSTYADMVALCPFTVPGINGIYQPLGSLADFSGEPIQGTWTLTITDNFFIDGGTLTGWELEICEVIPEVLYATPDTLQTCVGESASFSLQMGDSFDAASGVSV
ncbi:MAG: proprotein convertase P-domain-containing protein, partial [Bacteroidota bacterium]